MSDYNWWCKIIWWNILKFSARGKPHNPCQKKMSKNLTFRLARNKKERRHQAEQLRKTRQEEGIGGIGGRRFLISCCDFPAGNVSIITFRTIMIEHKCYLLTLKLVFLITYNFWFWERLSHDVFNQLGWNFLYWYNSVRWV